VKLRFTDGTITVTFGHTSSENTLRQYTPQTPDTSFLSDEPILDDGGEVFSVTYRNIAEQASVSWVGDTLSDQRDSINILNQLFDQARYRQRTGLGDRVYVEFQPVDGEDWYRSEVLSGRVLIDDSYRLGLQLSSQELFSTIIFTRRYYWEGPEEQIPLTNGNGIDDLDGLTVYNCDDDLGEYVSRDNWVSIAAEDVVGDLPAPIRLEMENTYNDEDGLAQVWISHNVHSNPESMTHILEAEDATGGTTKNWAFSSGGQYQQYTVSGTEQELAFTWDLTSEMLANCAGNYFKLLARFQTGMDPRNFYFQFKLYYRQLSPIWESQEVNPEQDFALTIRDLATVQLPPWLPESGSPAPLELRMYVRDPNGVGTVQLDFLQLSPVDNYCVLRHIVGSVEYGETLVFDGMENLLYVETADGDAGTFTRYGSKAIMLWPERDQRLYFLMHSEWMNQAEVDRTIAVKAYHRPRRLSL